MVDSCLQNGQDLVCSSRLEKTLTTTWGIKASTSLHYSISNMIDPKAIGISCHLLSIPTEIWALILFYLSPKASGCGIRRSDAWVSGSTSILRTCKQLNVEGPEIVYGRSRSAVDVARDSIKIDSRYLWGWKRSIRRHSCIFPQCFGE